MELYQFKTLVMVAREGSIIRASEQLFLSQPAVSAHVKAMEEELGLRLFNRTPRGMSMTSDGAQLLDGARHLLTMHRQFVDEARRIKVRLQGLARIGAPRGISTQLLGRLLARLSESSPHLEVRLEQCNSTEVTRLLEAGTLDLGLFVETETPVEGLNTIDVDRFGVHLAAPKGWVEQPSAPNWEALSLMPWIRAGSNSCFERAAEAIFLSGGFRPVRTISVDHESVTRTLIAEGVGVGLLHQDSALAAQRNGEIDLIGDVHLQGRILFGYLSQRAKEPLIRTVTTSLRDVVSGRS